MQIFEGWIVNWKDRSHERKDSSFAWGKWSPVLFFSYVWLTSAGTDCHSTLEQLLKRRGMSWWSNERGRDWLLINGRLEQRSMCYFLWTPLVSSKMGCGSLPSGRHEHAIDRRIRVAGFNNLPADVIYLRNKMNIPARMASIAIRIPRPWKKRAGISAIRPEAMSQRASNNIPTFFEKSMDKFLSLF